MPAMTDLVTEMAERLFSDLRAGASSREHTLEPLWSAVEEAGVPRALLTENDGGFGFSPRESLSIVRIAAGHAAPAPIAETMLANWLLATAGLDPAKGPAAAVVVPVIGGRHAERLGGTTRRVPWGRQLKTVAALTTDGLLFRLESGWICRHGMNLAEEPRDDLDFDMPLSEAISAPSPVDPDTLFALGATIRALEIAGAAETVLHLTVGYANDRKQFGRPIGEFQVVQQNLAIMAEQAAAARAAADMAADALPLALSSPDAFRLYAAAAKLRSGEAAGLCAGIAHQVHGAIGITREYPLHALTRRLWSWRDELGNESYWADRIGAAVFAQTPDELWPFLADQPGAPQ